LNCKNVKNNLTAYIHGELDKNELKTIHQHLAVCEDCLREEIELRKTGRLLDQFQMEALPENFDFQLRQKMKQTRRFKINATGSVRRIIYAVAATLLLTLGLEFIAYQFFTATTQPSKFADYPSNKTVFKSVQYDKNELSWKERYMAKFKTETVSQIFENQI